MLSVKYKYDCTKNVITKNNKLIIKQTHIGSNIDIKSSQFVNVFRLFCPFITVGMFSLSLSLFLSLSLSLSIPFSRIPFPFNKFCKRFFYLPAKVVAFEIGLF